MTPEEKETLEKRRLDARVQIYRYLLNGVPVEKVMAGFGKTEREVMDIFRLVSRALYEYCFRRKQPLNVIDCVATAVRQKGQLMPLLTKVNLDRGSAYGKLVQENIKSGASQDFVMDLLHEMAV